MMNTEITTRSTQNLAAQTLSPEMFDRWTAYLDVRERTVETYKKNTNYFLQYLIDNQISQPTRETVISYRDSLRATHKATTVHGYIQAVKLFFQWTEQEGLYPNIAERVKAGKIDPEYKRDFLTANQSRDVIKHIDTETLTGKRDLAIISLLLTTGLRTIEVTRANKGDLRTLGECTVLFLQGKGRDGKALFVKVPAVVESAIRDYFRERGKVSDTEPLFASHANRNAGERLTTRSVSRICKEAMQAAGIDDERHTAHSLRHTAGTLALLNGSTITEVQQLLRHSNVNTTLIYAHTLDRLESKSEDRISKAIFGK